MNTRYTTIGTDQVPHIKKLINWLIAEVISAGGDGDALWYSRFYSVDEIFSILKECDLYDFTIDKQDNRITFGTGQEQIASFKLQCKPKPKPLYPAWVDKF
jgi:hypothetical protein